jgi:SAM-dependent methyltransferase
MSGYVLAHRGDEAERQRMALLDEFHGPLTASQLEAVEVAPGWRCLEVGAGAGGNVRRLARRVGPTGHVVAIDLETQWLDQLRSDVVDVRQADITTAELPPGSFDLVLAQMLLLHLPDPADTCRKLLGAVRPDGFLIVHDADFGPVALDDATELEAAGVQAMLTTMQAAGVHMDLGAHLEELLRRAGAHIEHVEAQSSHAHGGQTAAVITAITLERFRGRAVDAGTSDEALSAAIAALGDPDRTFTGPTRWIVRARAPQGGPSRSFA